ncbi:hypothetical protein BYT27DRAFT_7115334 [Phlegmacium glaucopus]|nr:hypothetical protein BYT27DRAFT_7115334 [Phlegmacium glaucopus]
MAGVTSVSDSENSNKEELKAKAKAESVKDDVDSEGEEGGSEYEIEEVLDAKRGYFPEGRMGYYVKWKGYGESENSWVDELDAGNADDLIAEFWRKNPNRKRVVAKPKTSPQKPRKSAARDDGSDIGSTSIKKRGRKSVSKVESEDGMDVDEVVEARPPKKAKKNVANAKKDKADSSDVEERIIQNMDRHMDKPVWESLVKNVDTVERVGDTLIVFFTLNTGEAVKAPSKICKERFPQKLLQFYEDNLRWRQVDQDEASP